MAVSHACIDSFQFWADDSRKGEHPPSRDDVVCQNHCLKRPLLTAFFGVLTLHIPCLLKILKALGEIVALLFVLRLLVRGIGRTILAHCLCELHIQCVEDAGVLSRISSQIGSRALHIFILGAALSKEVPVVKPTHPRVKACTTASYGISWHLGWFIPPMVAVLDPLFKLFNGVRVGQPMVGAALA